MRMTTLPRLAWRSTACLASGTALFVAMAAPAAAIDVDLKAPEVACGTGAPYLALLVEIDSSATGFGASATAHLCNAPAIQTVVTLQAVGAGASSSPTVAGGPIFFAPFETKAGNDATVSGHSATPSSTAQSVVVNVTGVGVGVGSEPVNSCQFVYDRVLRTRFELDGCNVGVTVLD